MKLWNSLGLRWRFLLSVGSMVIAIVILLTWLHSGQLEDGLSSVKTKVNKLSGDIKKQQGSAFDALVKEQETAIETSLMDKAKSLAGLMTKLAPVSLASFDTEVLFSTLDDYCEQVCNDPDVLLCYVADPKGTIRTKFRNDTDQTVVELVPANKRATAQQVAASLEASTEVFAYTSDIVLEDELIGRTTLLVSKKSMRDHAEQISAKQKTLESDIGATFATMDTAVETEIGNQTDRSWWTSAIVGLLAIVLAVIAIILIIKSVVGPLREIVDTLAAVASGDLTRSVTTEVGGELEELAISCNQMIVSLSSLVGQINKSADQLRTASGTGEAAAKALDDGAKAQRSEVDKISSQTTQVSAQMEEVSGQIEEMASGIEQASATVDSQVAFVERVSTSIQEMSASTQSVDENAKKAQNQSDTTVEQASKGREAVRTSIRGMEEISETISGLATGIGQLGSRSSQIGEIVETITQIASQTNLLALNAAIEAARAGEHGRGFAVVADEVRKLAERTASATEEIEDLVRGMQSSVGNAVKSTDESIQKVSRGSDLASNVGKALEEIVVSIQDTAEAVQSIIAATEEQTAANQESQRSVDELMKMARQIAKGMAEQSKGAQQISLAIAQTAGSMEQTSAAVSNVSEEATRATTGAGEMAKAAREQLNQAAALGELTSQFTLAQSNEAKSVTKSD